MFCQIGCKLIKCIVSETLERAGSSEIGRLLQGCSKSPSFGSGTISKLSGRCCL